MGAGDAESAAILTPYNGQVRLIRRILKEHTGELYSKVPCLPPALPMSPVLDISQQEDQGAWIGSVS